MVLTRAAEADLESIGAWLLDHVGQRSIQMVRDLRGSCHALGDMPLRHPLVPAHESTGVRRRVHGNYLIFYIVSEETITVLRILHGAQDYERLLFP